ncbi:MAG: hypothetical protein GKR89_27395 [Candidatus Latescibacteria bacterium]|nr:hypothetical protein [Candidatus Latescibacterota bacterium]
MPTALSQTRRRWLSRVLTALFLVAMFMGSGPGLHLINPDLNDPGAQYTFGPIPLLYAWGLLWYGVQLAVVLTAYFTLWNRPQENA